jgi:shikimate kinase
LYGFKGAGKSYFAKKLGLPFIDTDRLIEEKEGLPCREIVQKKGWEYFRDVEKQIITSLQVTETVIAVGGGAVLDPESRAYLQNLGILIYLNCPKEILRSRFTLSDFEKLYSQRIPIYETISPYQIDLEGKTDNQVVEAIWQVINSATNFASPHGASPTEKP